MVNMFYASSFNGDLSKWDVSSVTNMEGMFRGASYFNSDISKWDVSKVTNMNLMFQNAKSFSQTLCAAWKTSAASKNQIFDTSPGKICTATGKTTSVRTRT